jgi:polysaccharide chain length determinant protein (PEP-CTERM system associated)
MTNKAQPNTLFLPLSLMRALWKRKVIILAIAGVLSLVTFVVVYRLPPVYSAETLILVDSQKIPDKYVTSTVSTDLQDRLATISQQILSATRLEKIISDFNLYRKERKSKVQEEILESMRRDIAIKLERGWTLNKPGAFRITYQGEDPNTVAQVANRIANLYIEENLKTREVQAEGTAEFIDNQLQEAKKRLDELEASLEEYKVKYNGELPQQENTLNASLGRLDQQLGASRDAANRAEEQKAILQNTLAATEATLKILTSAPSSPRMDTAGSAPITTFSAQPAPAPSSPKRSEALEAQLDALLQRYGPEHPDVRRLRAQIATEKASESKAEAKTEPLAPSPATAPRNTVAAAPARPPAQIVPPVAELNQVNERIASLKAQIAIQDREIQARTAEQSRIQREIGAAEAHVARLPLREQEMAKVTRDYQIERANYQSLLDKKLSAEMATDMERRQKSERFTILDPARVPEKPQKPNRPTLYTVGCLLSLMTGIAAAFVIEMKDNTILGEWELPADALVLARLPHIVVSVAPAPEKSRPRGAWRPKPVLVYSAVLGLCALGLAAAGWYYIAVIRQ